MQDPRNIPGIDIEMAGAMLKSRERQPEPPLDVTVAPIADVRTRYLAERAYWNEDGPALPRIVDHSVKGPHGPIPVRLYYPRGNPNLPLLIYLHGGGFIKGGIESHDKICRWIASRSGAAVASVDYRLSPEHKFPTPLEEAVAVFDWATGSAQDLLRRVAGDADPGRLAQQAPCIARRDGVEAQVHAVGLHGHRHVAAPVHQHPHRTPGAARALPGRVPYLPGQGREGSALELALAELDLVDPARHRLAHRGEAVPRRRAVENQREDGACVSRQKLASPSWGLDAEA